MIKAIIFDWHGVLDKRSFAGMLEVLSEVWYSVFAPTKRERKETSLGEYKELIKQNFLKDSFAYATGKMSPEEFWSLLEYEGDEVGIREARNYLLEIEKNEPLWQLLPELKRRYKLAILSDCPPDKMKIIREGVDLSFFERTYFSCEYGLSKSHPQFFEIALKELGITPEQCLFVDDNAMNREYAAQQGFQTHLYRTVSDLERRIRHL